MAEGLLEGTPVILHGDISPGHVLADSEGSLTGVIDWGDVAFGDPARDLIFLYEDWGDDFLRLALEGYGLADGPSFRRRVLAHYVVDQLAWTAEAAAAGRRGDLEHGVAALRAAVVDFHGSA
jgi:aminoglycoside phosphotransferase (APT) family kinase protein